MVGFHVSISGSIDKAVDRATEIGCDTFQIFTRNPRSWKYGELDVGLVEAFRRKRAESGIDPVFGHMPYIMNLASPHDDVYGRSVESLSVGVKRCSFLGIPFLVTHLGSHLGSGPEAGVGRVVDALDTVLGDDESDVVVLLENGSGTAKRVGSRFEELSLILSRVECPGKVAVCLDTCHAFVAGYDLRTPEALRETLDNFDAAVGLDRIGLVHLNDSMGGMGSMFDHHEHVGLGKIGVEGFRAILDSPLIECPLIMETPMDDRRDDVENLKVVRSLAGSLGRD
jgi:deoxyribonuclease-4